MCHRDWTGGAVNVKRETFTSIIFGVNASTDDETLLIYGVIRPTSK